MNKYSIAPLALTSILIATTASASSLVKYINASDQTMTVDSNAVAPGSSVSGILGDNGSSISIDGKTISITDSHTPCLRDGPWFNMPYAWYMNLSVDGVLVGQLCAQLQGPDSTTTESVLAVASVEGQYALEYNNLGLYSSLYPSLSSISTLPVTYSW